MKPYENPSEGDSTPLRDAARAYVAGGLSLIPIDRATKRPHFELLPRLAGKPGWAQFMQRRAAWDEVELWVGCGTQLAAVAGPVSGGLLVLDFDVAEFYDAWLAAVGELAAGLPVQRTGRAGGAYQVWLRCPEPGGNQELAYAVAVTEPTAIPMLSQAHADALLDRLLKIGAYQRAKPLRGWTLRDGVVCESPTPERFCLLVGSEFIRGDGV